MEKNLEELLLQESRRTLDLAGCKSAEELLKSVLHKVAEEQAGVKAEARELADEELDQVIAAGGAKKPWGGGDSKLKQDPHGM